MIRDAPRVSATLPPAPPPTAPPVPKTAPEPPAMPPPNPSLRLDVSLALVVIEFRDSGGQVTQSIPSPRELDAYRSSDREPAAAPQLDLTG